jgi:hypothetical protein
MALAGFPVGEQYNVPWSVVPVHKELESHVFPFVEDASTHMECGATSAKVGFPDLVRTCRSR